MKALMKNVRKLNYPIIFNIMMLKEDLEKTELFHAQKYMDCDC